MDLIYVIVIISLLGPIIGSFIGVVKKPSQNLMYNMLAFAAGVMLAISFLELLPEAIAISSVFIAGIGFVIGSIFMFLMDKLIPHIHPEFCKQEQGCNLKRTSIYLLLGIFLHNFPEGLAIATGTISSMKGALMIALAIAIHNIPEGICTSAPYYYCTKKKWKSFFLSSSTTIPILLGFLLGKFVFGFINPNFLGLIIAATAGLMIYISADELIPTSCSKHDCDNGSWSHSAIFSLIFGVLFVLILTNI